MENPVLQIKDALIRVLKVDPDTDVFFWKKSAQTCPWRDSLKPGCIVDLNRESLTVDGIYTITSVMVMLITMRRVKAIILRSSLKLQTTQPFVHAFAGDRKITIGNADINVVDHVLHYIFTINFRHSEEQKVANDRMEELGVSLKKESE